MRTLYTVLFYILIPLILLRLLWRSLKAPDYRRRWLERFGFYGRTFPQQVIWFHAVSVGEAEALFPLVRRFQNQSPSVKILITTTTPTGSARVKAVMSKSVEHVYFPYDIPFALERFLRCFKPVMAVIVETEIWPNLYHACAKHNIPLFLINARLSEKSAGRYKKIPSLIKPALANLKLVAAQTDEDARRFNDIGVKAEQVITLGNMKFDVEIPEDIIQGAKELKASIFNDRFVWVAGSTHSGEEQSCLDVYKVLKPIIPKLLLILVPRHPERFVEVGSLCEKNELHVVHRTSNRRCDSKTDIYLADTMGELKLLYAAADLAFVGGSLVNIGGHNVLEALAVGVPVIFGPYMANFKEIANKLIADEASICSSDKDMLGQTIMKLYSDANLRRILVENGKLFLQKNCGVTDSLYQLLSKVL
ncbi:MAG: lipid IV(A) 3-deoxy-D-manno-octulosonic acid transferase [Methylococcaceae bacterium]|nr:lipid IV(A) 3-deoxy-D-manno-octulosonic acid transferase [Methylococcaceae bacterium]